MFRKLRVPYNLLHGGSALPIPVLKNKNIMTTPANNVQPVNIVQPRILQANQSIEEFLEDFERVCIANEWSDEKAARILPALIPASSVHQETIRAQSDAVKQSFKSIKAAFEGIDALTKILAIQELHTCSRKKDENFQQYASRITRLVNKVYPNMAARYRTELTSNIFVVTLPRDLIATAWKEVSGHPDINKAARTAQLLDTVKMAESRSSVVSSSKEPCGVCGKTNHITKNCFKNKKAPKKDAKDKKRDNDHKKKNQNVTAITSNKDTRMLTRAMFDGKEQEVLVDFGSNVTVLPRSLVADTSKIESSDMLNLNSASLDEIKSYGWIDAKDWL